MTFFKPSIFSLLVASVLMTACNPSETTSKSTVTPPSIATDIPERVITKDDKFSYANYDEVRITHIDLNLDVNFDAKVLDGIATLDFERVKPEANMLVLDTKDLLIKSVRLFSGSTAEAPTDYTMDAVDKVLGEALRIPLTDNTDKVLISYRTSPIAEGLQWLSPAQTAGKKKPYLFSQAQAINARTMAPLQDTPAVRMTYSATLRVPDGLRPLMSASQGEKDENGEYHFDMPQPIPSYLIAIAVGDVKFKAINDHPLMEASNTKFYGPYRWGRYDLIVLPPSFPYGGMENPRLSFMTPTLIAGDKSLTNVVAHELAHSWSGNLVTNSSWRDAWLNEGFTSYVENRVMEDLYGEERAVMEQALDMEGLKRAISEAKRPELTHLKLPEDMEHPDDAFTLVSYIKGANFLFFLEDRFGRVINNLPAGLSKDQFAELDSVFEFTGTQNAETAFAWYMKSIRGNYDEAFPALEEFLMTVGRGKFIYRLYGALKDSSREDLQYWAQDIYESARPGYHPIAQRRIDAILVDDN